MSIKQRNILLIAVTLFLCYFPLCNRINLYCIQAWDESRNITNAIEMLGNHQWLTRYFEGKPDMWDLKPPFLVWLQAASFNLFGFTETAARLPSMFFSMSTVLLLLWMGNKLTGSIYPGILGAIIMVSSRGYYGEHMARFGDHEAMLGFFITSMIFFAWLYSETSKKIYLVLTIVSLFLGWFTKNIIAFMFLPGMFVWFLSKGKIKDFLLNRTFWIGCLIMLCLIASYYLLREKSSPGYMQEVWMNELFGRYFDKSENYHYHKNDFWYYWQGFVDGRFLPYIYLFIVGMVFAVFRRSLQNRNFLIYVGIVLVSYFLILSAGTKNFWYDGPLYPTAALFVGLFLYSLFAYFPLRVFRLIYGILIVLSIYPAYANAIRFTMEFDKNASHPLQSLCYYLKDKDHKIPQRLMLVPDGFYTPLYFYIAQAKEEGKQIELKKPNELIVGDTFLMNEATYNVLSDTAFQMKAIDKSGGCVMGEVVGK